ncbi:Do family serine endopeptidase [Alkalicaulis satelles]|uniref:Do family serine endopeptidase n=1 Tax=Alkalicaulis satelles TaxID=2609175 RepID=A0A5M6ZK19_9PROT|nr:Do family serine endopeptidase [Alkalicaulis satelles]KAA5805163.1 Do family serine endopeptidase [Alkalicaulis satelles]
MTLTQRLLVSAAAGLALAAAAPALTGFAPPAYAQTYAAPNGAPMSFADLIDRVSPAVVSIEAEGVVRPEDGPDMSQLPPQFREFLERFGGAPGQQPQRPRRSQGSGFFISDDGLLVTNNHVIEGADTIRVALSDGRSLTAEIVGRDELTDLALLRVEPSSRPFKYVELARDLDIRVGDWVVAVGNPFGLGGTATAGIVSATGRQMSPAQAYIDFLQIDAPINRGNSGGPAFDLNGRVVGVNSAIISPTGGNVGIGFAIPSDIAASIIDQLIADGMVRRGYLGISPADLTDDLRDAMGLDADVEGVLINQVLPGTPAAQGGLQNGDIVLSINGDRVSGARALTQRVGAFAPTEQITVRVLRDGRERNIRVRLAERPADAGGTAQPVTPPEPDVTRLFGMTLETPSEQDRQRLELGQRGLLVADVEPDSEAARKGLRPGDAILEAGGRDVRSVDEFRAAAAQAQSRGRAALLVFVAMQGGQRRYAALELSEME